MASATAPSTCATHGLAWLSTVKQPQPQEPILSPPAGQDTMGPVVGDVTQPSYRPTS